MFGGLAIRHEQRLAVDTALFGHCTLLWPVFGGWKNGFMTGASLIMASSTTKVLKGTKMYLNKNHRVKVIELWKCKISEGRLKPRSSCLSYLQGLAWYHAFSH